MLNRPIALRRVGDEPDSPELHPGDYVILDGKRPIGTLTLSRPARRDVLADAVRDLLGPRLLGS